MSYSASFGDYWNKCRLSAPLEVISACFSKLTLCTNFILGLESIHLDGWLTLYLTGIDDAQVPSESSVKYIQRVFICGEMFIDKNVIWFIQKHYSENHLQLMNEYPAI